MIPAQAGLAPIVVLGFSRRAVAPVVRAFSSVPEMLLPRGERGLLDRVTALHPATGGWFTARLTAHEVRIRDRATLDAVVQTQFSAAAPTESPLLLDDSPQNLLRVGYLATMFPAARFLWVHQPVAVGIASLADAWASAEDGELGAPPGWEHPTWSGPLVPGWKSLAPGLPLLAAQWSAATSALLEDLEALDPARWQVTTSERLRRDPTTETARLLEALGLTADAPTSTPGLLPVPEGLDTHLPALADLASRAARLASTRLPSSTTADAAITGVAASPSSAGSFETVLRSSAVTELLEQWGRSAVVSLFTENALGLLSPGAPGSSRRLLGPMGIAVTGGRVVVATGTGVDELARPSLARLRSHDLAGLSPRELVADGCGETWVASTTYSALIGLDQDAGHLVRWQPAFISAIEAGDRCHLNGIALRDGEVTTVSALGASDQPGGWRERMADGGVLIDVASREIVVAGLCMPHSPRWHEGRLWVLQSGSGELCVVDPPSGEVTPVCALPGFARGLVFHEGHALIGLSRARASVFAELPIAQRGGLRSGLWAVELATGRVAAEHDYGDSVREMFDVQLIEGSGLSLASRDVG